MTNNKQDHIGEANKMVTAVEWLIDELIKNHGIQANLYSEFEQAKEMEVLGKEMSYAEGYKEGYHRAIENAKYQINKWIDKELKITQ
jgi:flagellar biosynthesis/type III secretory pathway protein FliH